MGSLPGPRLSVARLGDVSSQSHCCKTTHGVIYAIAHLTHTFFKSHTPRGNSPSGKRSSSTCGTYRVPPRFSYVAHLLFFDYAAIHKTDRGKALYCDARTFLRNKKHPLSGSRMFGLAISSYFYCPWLRSCSRWWLINHAGMTHTCRKLSPQGTCVCTGFSQSHERKRES